MSAVAVESFTLFAIMLGIAMPFLFILGIIGLIAYLVRGGGSSPNKQLKEEETQLIQELHHGLLKMEQRVEALETILIERSRKGKDE